MNIQIAAEQLNGQHHGARPDLYRTVPFWRELLAEVRAGQTEFAENLAAMGLRERFGLATSAVHDYEDIEVHALILGIGSTGRWDEVRAKSYLTYASHWIDDFFDGAIEPHNFAQLFKDRIDVRRAIANMGPGGAVGFEMAKRARHPRAVYKALHRMLYGGLIQRSLDRTERAMLIAEYFTVATEFLNRELALEIARLRPEAYWATNKTVLELLYSAEEHIDFSCAEFWSLLYAPVLYYEDAEAERARGELNFERDEMPTINDMIDMMRLGARYLWVRYQPNYNELRQLRFALRVLPNLPERLVNEYQRLGGILG